ncbi:hypothetical protein ACFYV7_12465 [Nocardia suismassiliense]|uniref:Uncharacterized protein n=1 Tax=Nocardia suismassiliense TaxID=2077092 RepID=A0ABW6QQV9_9NOCA
MVDNPSVELPGGITCFTRSNGSSSNCSVNDRNQLHNNIAAISVTAQANVKSERQLGKNSAHGFAGSVQNTNWWYPYRGAIIIVDLKKSKYPHHRIEFGINSLLIVCLRACPLAAGLLPSAVAGTRSAGSWSGTVLSATTDRR